jgi:hypothetical protein
VNIGIAGGIVTGEEVEELGLAAAVVEDNIILLFTRKILFCFMSGVLKATPLKIENARTGDDVIISVNIIDNMNNTKHETLPPRTIYKTPPTTRFLQYLGKVVLNAHTPASRFPNWWLVSSYGLSAHHHFFVHSN